MNLEHLNFPVFVSDQLISSSFSHLIQESVLTDQGIVLLELICLSVFSPEHLLSVLKGILNAVAWELLGLGLQPEANLPCC